MHAALETTRSGSRRRQAAAGGFSLLEMMIAIAVLGIGLVMVAAIFPVALDQHRRSADETLALQHAYQGRAIIRAKIEPTLGSGPHPPPGKSIYNLACSKAFLSGLVYPP